MNIQSVAIITCLFLFRMEFLSAQLDSIFHQGVYRTFIKHVPTNFPTQTFQLVLNLHGLNSNAVQQELYSQFNTVADSLGFIVVYPNAVNGSWNFSTDKDVDFISKLIDTIRQKYSLNDCLFLTGMSMGGFMSYHLACRLDKDISAIAVVAGNMLQIQQRVCNPVRGLPVLHFHGTSDAIVSYQGASGIPPVDSTIQWWVQQNQCNPSGNVLVLPDVDPTDQCMVLKYHFKNGRNESEVQFYKIIDGGHTWPGAFPVPALGATNQDINASRIIGEFFLQHCQSTTGQNESGNPMRLKLFPNPVRQMLNIEWPNQTFNIRILDIHGAILLQQNQNTSYQNIDVSFLNNGFYIVHIHTESIQWHKKIFVLH